MQVAIITDSHWGTRGDNQSFLKYFTTFYRETFFPTLYNRGIKHIIHLGDVFDRRKYLNFFTLNAFNEAFLAPVVDGNFELDVIVGNHDTYFRNSNQINSLKELQLASDKIRSYWAPIEKTYDTLPVLLLPWVPSADYATAMAVLEQSSAKVLMGHLDIQGFDMGSGRINDHGYPMQTFDRFALVFSGHYHKKQSLDGIHYLGAPYEITWADFNLPKGFHIFDTATMALEHVRNPKRIFHKLHYDDKGKEHTEVLDASLEHCKDSYVKVIIRQKTNPYLFDLYMDALHKVNPAHISVVEDHNNLPSLLEEDLVNQTEDTLTIMRKYVMNMQTSANKESLVNLLAEVYQEAVAMDIE